jgi:hypothetical protein
MQPTPKVLPGYERAISPSYYAIGTASISPHLCGSGTLVCTSNMRMVMCHGKGNTTPSLRQIQCMQPVRSRMLPCNKRFGSVVAIPYTSQWHWSRKVTRADVLRRISTIVQWRWDCWRVYLDTGSLQQ